jgi:hypothetical protein
MADEATFNTQLGVRLTPEEVQRIDALVENRKAREPGIPFTRTAIARSLILRALPLAEADLAKDA